MKPTNSPRTTAQRWTGRRPGRRHAGLRIGALQRDLLFLVAAAVVAALAILPGRTGEGTSIATMQLVGQMAAMIVAAIGLNLVAGLTRLVSLGQGAFYALGAYAFSYLLLDVGLPALPAMLVTVLGCAGVGAVVALGSLRLRGPEFTMITLALAVLVQQILLRWPELGAASGYPNPLQHGTGLLDPVSVLGFEFDPPLTGGVVATAMVPIAVITVVALVLYRNLCRSAWGRSLRAVGESDMLAAHLGVNVFWRKTAALALSSALGAVGGIFYVLIYAHVQPESFDLFLSISILLAVLLGGGGTVLGPVIGSAVIVWLQQSQVLDGVTSFEQEHLSSSWYLSTPGLLGVLLILVLFLMPQGITGTLAKLWSHRAGQTTSVETEPGIAGGGDERRVVRLLEQPDQMRDGAQALLLTDVTKRFGGLVAVDALDLSVDYGSVHAIIGPNGAGKSTVANLVTGVYRPGSGSVAFEGTELSTRRPHDIARLGVARTFQTPQLFSSETVLENVKAGFADTASLPWWKASLKPPGQYRREAELDRDARALLARVGLAHDERTLAGALAYGKARALEIARALARQPRLLILDEPAAGLNSTEVAVLGELLMELRRDGMALVVVEHHMDLVASVADVVTCMAEGRVLARGTAAEVLADQEVVAAYLGRPAEDGGETLTDPRPAGGGQA
ncbi:branched-chain amino acid ABC transporter ATP-binding protein/permease [Nocardioides acrostichi]|uniref:Branched-chain amino acid ABC transporter ATP-binding protein/permease n=1 Tax=Nocardioides acrostichi TaxID=2784339 RepID=A0A930Y9W4_9ACTN|nr:branched-chain amino acid ABC transporter ATP-binding protein/permease [Nocardioides acrostichi]MBF4160793.1 branched-chain amino acid ABC transporter ATP-binding protein/permease [Nocardioides acrostichi]